MNDKVGNKLKVNVGREYVCLKNMKYKVGDKLKVKEGCEDVCLSFGRKYVRDTGCYVIISDVKNNSIHLQGATF